MAYLSLGDRKWPIFCGCAQGAVVASALNIRTIVDCRGDRRDSYLTTLASAMCAQQVQQTVLHSIKASIAVKCSTSEPMDYSTVGDTSCKCNLCLPLGFSFTDSMHAASANEEWRLYKSMSVLACVAHASDLFEHVPRMYGTVQYSI